MRCLTLAALLGKAGANISFISRAMPNGVSQRIGAHYPLHTLPPATTDEQQDASASSRVLRDLGIIDWLISDNYALGSQWESAMRSHTRKIMVIDDLANRLHDCDILLDQNLCLNFETRYDALLPVTARKFLGPKYALLRPEFYEAQAQQRVRDGRVRRILVSFGGGDASDETAKALKAILLLDRSDVAFEVVAGNANPNADALAQSCRKLPNVNFHRETANMAALMAAADLAIGACGTITWERCFLGLPAVTLVLAENQRPICEAVSATGAVLNLGWREKATAEDIAEAIAGLIDSPDQIMKMSQAARNIMRNNGTNELLSAILKR